MNAVIEIGKNLSVTILFILFFLWMAWTMWLNRPR